MGVFLVALYEHALQFLEFISQYGRERDPTSSLLRVSFWSFSMENAALYSS